MTTLTSPVPLGNGLLGITRLGDEASLSFVPRTNAVGLSYAITPSKYATALSLTYTLQKYDTSPVLLYYVISPPTSFAINGDGTIVKPDSLIFSPRPVIARTLLASPILQGYQQMTWGYSVLQWSEFQGIIKYYNPQQPLVMLTFPDQNGVWTQSQCVMLPPTYGQMAPGQVVTGVSFLFNRLFI